MTQQTPLILVINLNRAPDRLARIGQRLDELGLVWQRVSAVDGRLHDWKQPAWLDEKGFGLRQGREAQPGDVGCYVSHVRALECLAASSAPWGVILEDDAVLLDTFPAILAQLQQQSSDCDVVKFSGVHRGTPVRLKSLGPSHHLAVMLTQCTGASAYAVQREVAGRWAAPLLPMRIPYDHEFDRAWHWKFRLRYVLPYPCVHDQDVPSTIGLGSIARKRWPWWRRLPTFGWRAVNECRRLFYGLKTVLGARISGAR